VEYMARFIEEEGLEREEKIEGAKAMLEGAVAEVRWRIERRTKLI
jgi:hypothetical protein